MPPEETKAGILRKKHGAETIQGGKAAASCFCGFCRLAASRRSPSLPGFLGFAQHGQIGLLQLLRPKWIAVAAPSGPTLLVGSEPMEWTCHRFCMHREEPHLIFWMCLEVFSLYVQEAF